MLLLKDETYSGQLSLGLEDFCESIIDNDYFLSDDGYGIYITQEEIHT